MAKAKTARAYRGKYPDKIKAVWTTGIGQVSVELNDGSKHRVWADGTNASIPRVGEIYRHRNPKPRNPASAKGVTVIARKGAAIKSRSRRVNPASESTPYHVQEKLGTAWHTLSKCVSAEIAKFLATHYAKHHPDNSFRVVKV